MIQTRDESHVVGWDNDFDFEVAPSDDVFLVPEAVPARAVGAAFISGHSQVQVFHLDEFGGCTSFAAGGAGVSETAATMLNVKPGNAVVFCGPGVAKPLIVSILCRVNPAARVVVCPLIGPLAAFGQLAGGLMLKGLEKPRMNLFYRPVTDRLDLEFQEFDEKLGSDGIGRMAYLMREGIPVVNEMMWTPCISPFYGRVIHTEKRWGDPIYLMKEKAASKYFPTEPVSLRTFASAWVPVIVENTEEFVKVSGDGRGSVKIFTASHHVPGLTAFLNFVMLSSGRDFVASSDIKDVPAPNLVPLFRYNGAYNIDANMYAKVTKDGHFRPL